MSIDYQLYQMLNTTQIVIPQLLVHKAAVSQPDTPESFCLSTPPKLTKNSSQFSWKKKQSAFKKFRDRNSQKNQSAAQSQSQKQKKVEQKPRRIYCLIQKKGPIKQSCLNKASQTRIEQPACYFDPNMAPLYGEVNCQGISNELTTTDIPLVRTVSRLTIKIQQERPENQSLKIEPLPSKRSSQSCHPQLQIQRPDDPFIIVRHNSPQKSKTKFIKKQKQKCTTMKNENIKIAESIPEAMEISQSHLPFDSFRPPRKLSEQHGGFIEAIDVELSYPSEQQSEMEWQQQKYISCD